MQTRVRRQVRGVRIEPAAGAVSGAGRPCARVGGVPDKGEIAATMTDDTSPVATAATDPAQAQEWARALAGKRLLVTGAAGFIGGALFRRLRDYACDVTATVLHPHEAEAIRDQGGKAEVLDLAGDAPFDPHVRDVDIVFHLAALFQETGHREAMYRMVNETGALRLCQAAAAAGVRALHSLQHGRRAWRRQGDALQGDQPVQSDGSVSAHQVERASWPS